MDKTKDKLVFLVVFIIPVFIVVSIAWILIGNKIVDSNVIFGYLNGISVMIIPTAVLIVLGLVIRHFFFKR
ncbi:MAG: hypothetical protein EHM47_03045 [Ignavibacteriales bacterium]|nr:MAG: hypothetical protein EHM47_03045 [Ignavibacteriales bacterium]